MVLIQLMIVFLVLIVLGVPIVFSAGLPALLYFVMEGTPLLIIPMRMYHGTCGFLLIAIPLFILAGTVMNTAGITMKIFNFANVLVGHIPGGLGQVNILASMIFAGMSGSAIADAGGLGAIELNAMKEKGYPLDFSIGLTGASSTIGPIIPPSIPMVIYAFLADQSVREMFLGGIVPGLIMGVCLFVVTYIIALRVNIPRRKNMASIGKIASSFWTAFPSLLSPVIILGGIFGGMFTATEAAAISVVYAVLLGIVYNTINLSTFLKACQEAAIMSGMVLIIITTTGILAQIVTREGLDVILVNLLTWISPSPLICLYIITLVLLILGCFLQVTPTMILIVPFLMPVIKQIGIHPVHFGVVIILTLMIGLLTPPVGTVLFVMSELTQSSIEFVVKAMIPFFLALIVALFIVVTFPGTTLCLLSFLK